MAFLGKPYRVVYEGVNFRTGLTDVVAGVFRPDNASLGLFAMAEMPGMFAGRYYFDLNTTTADPEGEWIVGIFSPSESKESTIRVPLYLSPTFVSRNGANVRATVSANSLDGIANPTPELSSVVSVQDVGSQAGTQEVGAAAGSLEVSGSVEKDQIDGTVEC